MAVVLATDQLRTVIGPLTTTFTPPPSCTVALHGPTCNPWPCETVYRAQDCSGDTIADGTPCWPPAASGVLSPNAPFSGWGFYSPGLICPSGYISACTATAGGASDWPYEYSMVPGETAVGCCPNGFTCSYGYGQTCQSIAGSFATFPIATCADSSLQGLTTQSLPFYETSTAGYTTTRVQTIQILAPMIEIRWQESDRATTTSSTSNQTSTGSAPTTSHSPSSNLSTGAKAAIGVCVPIAAIAAVATAVFLWRKRRPPGIASGQEKKTPFRQELQGTPLAELPSNPAELSSTHEPHHELP